MNELLLPIEKFTFSFFLTLFTLLACFCCCFTFFSSFYICFLFCESLSVGKKIILHFYEFFIFFPFYFFIEYFTSTLTVVVTVTATKFLFKKNAENEMISLMTMTTTKTSSTQRFSCSPCHQQKICLKGAWWIDGFSGLRHMKTFDFIITTMTTSSRLVNIRDIRAMFTEECIRIESTVNFELKLDFLWTFLSLKLLLLKLMLKLSDVMMMTNNFRDVDVNEFVICRISALLLLLLMIYTSDVLCRLKLLFILQNFHLYPTRTSDVKLT